MRSTAFSRLARAAQPRAVRRLHASAPRLSSTPAAMAAAQPDVIIHLAAQAGVRYSLDSPRTYLDSNLVGTFNVMEAARLLKPRHFLLASTSSVYGGNTMMPRHRSLAGIESQIRLTMFIVLPVARQAVLREDR
jgi:nucleoside-diphosphate-sugar epimerase